LEVHGALSNIFAEKILQEVVKAAYFFFRFRGTRWYAHGLKEASEELMRIGAAAGQTFPKNQPSID
jgi:hypothetical protein